MKKYSIEEINNVLRHKGYNVFSNSSKPFNLNIVGIRNNDLQSNRFNDELVVYYLFQGKWEELRMDITTDPGIYYREHPMNVDGTIVLIPKQYKGVLKKGLHKGKPALIQFKKMSYWRDNNKDSKIDLGGKVFNQMARTDIHRAGRLSILVDKWSAGCQVAASNELFEEFMDWVDKAIYYWSNEFTYTLVTEQDFIDYEKLNN